MKTLSILMAVLFLFCPVLAADHVQKVDPPSAAKDAGKSPAHELSPMMLEIQANFEAARLAIEELRVRAQGADEKAALDIRREASRIKRESRVEMMRIQLRYARQEGRDDQVTELEEIIARMTAPPGKGVPVSRPANHQ